MIVATKELKCHFEKFCENEFPGKKYCSNLDNRKGWFYVQAGNKFGELLHYEYNGGFISLHIECEGAEGLQQYLRKNVREPEYEWIRWNRPDYGCRLKIPVNDRDSLTGSFLRIRDKMEPLIETYENNRGMQIEERCEPESMEEVTLYNRNLGEIFKMKLCIPDYQRIYCWEEKNVYQLWCDVSELTEERPYHMGAVILHRKGEEFHIVDGQQRLVTLTLILQQLNRKTGETTDEACPLPLLEQKFESDEACRYIAYNKYLINAYVPDNREAAIELRKKMLEQLTFSVLVLPDSSLELAYTFFSNQNSKGIPLSDYNLLKAHHLRFISVEAQAKHLAGKWDSLLVPSEDAEADLKQTLGMYLFRLRKWMRKKNWDESAFFRVKNEFEAALMLTEIPPFGEKFDFNEKIQGGTHFFVYADFFVGKYREFSATPHYRELYRYLNTETHWFYRDVIATLLFGYFLKFGNMYLTEALVCIERLISRHRYDNNRALLYKVLEYAGNTEIIMMIDQATSPTFFLAEAVYFLKRSGKPDGDTPIKRRYRENIKNIYGALRNNSVYGCNEEVESLLEEDGK